MTYDDTMTSTPSHTSLRRCPSMRLAWHAPNDPNVRMERIEHALVFQLEALIRLGCKWVQHATTIYYIYILYIYVPTMYTGATHGTTWYNKCLLDNGDIAVPPGRPDAGFAARSVSTASRKHIAAPWTRRKLWAKKAFVVGKPWENYGKI